MPCTKAASTYTRIGGQETSIQRVFSCDHSGCDTCSLHGDSLIRCLVSTYVIVAIRFLPEGIRHWLALFCCKQFGSKFIRHGTTTLCFGITFDNCVGLVSGWGSFKVPQFFGLHDSRTVIKPVGIENCRLILFEKI